MAPGGYATPATRSGRSSGICTGVACGAAPTSVRPAAIVPPPCSTSSAATRSAAIGGSCGSTVRSNRREASLGSLCLRAVRAIVAGSQWAASMTTSMGSAPGRISVDAPPITPARPIGPESSVMSRSSGSRRRCTSSSVVSVSPGRARRTTIGPDSRPASKACSGWPSSSIT